MKISCFALLMIITQVGFCMTAMIAKAGERKQITLTYGDNISLPVTIVLPNDYDSKHKYPVIFALPPGPGTGEMVNVVLEKYWEHEGQERGYIVVSPAILGQKLEADTSQVVNSVFNWMDENLSYDKNRVTLTGVSNGGLGAFYVAEAEAERFRALMVLPGGYQGSANNLKKLKGKPVWLIVGGNDTVWTKLSENTLEALKSVGAEAKLDVLPDQEHILSISPKQLFGWIAKETKE